MLGKILKLPWENGSQKIFSEGRCFAYLSGNACLWTSTEAKIMKTGIRLFYQGIRDENVSHPSKFFIKKQEPRKIKTNIFGQQLDILYNFEVGYIM